SSIESSVELFGYDAPNTAWKNSSTASLSFDLVSANTTDISLSNTSTRRSMNSAEISSLPNSTESVLVFADCSGVVNLPVGKPTHSFELFSRVLANTTATYGGLS